MVTEVRIAEALVGVRVSTGRAQEGACQGARNGLSLYLAGEYMVYPYENSLRCTMKIWDLK